jgi:hypothetical protein
MEGSTGPKGALDSPRFVCSCTQGGTTASSEDQYTTSVNTSAGTTMRSNGRAQLCLLTWMAPPGRVGGGLHASIDGIEPLLKQTSGRTGDLARIFQRARGRRPLPRVLPGRLARIRLRVCVRG